ncbi:MAG: chaperone modulator CbpM [Gammaproteobacteria bacterium]
MAKDITLFSGTVLDEHTRFTLVELCVLGKTNAEWIIELVDEGVLDPEGETLDAWRFDANALKRLQAARRLQRDLRINLPGAALVLDLLEEIEALRQQSRPR